MGRPTVGGSSTSVARPTGAAVRATADAPYPRGSRVALQLREPGLRARIRTDVGVGAVGPPTQRGQLVLGRGPGVHEASVHPSSDQGQTPPPEQHPEREGPRLSGVPLGSGTGVRVSV